MTLGFNKKNDKGGHDFIPTEKKTGIHSSSINNDRNVEEPNNGHIQRGNNKPIEELERTPEWYFAQEHKDVEPNYGHMQRGNNKPVEAPSRTIPMDEYMKNNSEMFKEFKKNDVKIATVNYGLEIEDGRIQDIDIHDPNAGFLWTGHSNSANSFLIRLENSSVKNDFLKDVKENKVSFEIFKNQIKENLSGKLDNDKGDDGLYELTGDNGLWEYDNHDTSGHSFESAKESFFDGSTHHTEQEQELIMDKAYMISLGYSYGDYLQEHGEKLRKEVLEKLESSDSFEEYMSEINDESFKQGIVEDVFSGFDSNAFNTIAKAEGILIKEGRISKPKESE